LKDKFLPFSRPSISEKDVRAVTDVLRSGWITTGKKNAEFEKCFCEYVGCSKAVALSSATAGMHLVLKALGIGPNDEVITPSMTWVSTVNLIVLAGATPVFADIDRDTLMVTTDSIKSCLTDRTRLIIPVHFAGAPVDMKPLMKEAHKRQIAVVQDAAHALGTEYHSEKIGKKGTVIFSFHPIKNITSGEGGMLCCGDSDLLVRIRRLKFHGLGQDAFDRKTQGRAPQAEVLEPGFKYNMTDMAAALGNSQLARINDFIAKRAELNQLYRDLLKDVDEIKPLCDPTYPNRHSRHLFIVRLDIEKAKITRDEFMLELKLKNIGTGIHFKAVHLQKYYRQNLKTPSDSLPNTKWNSKRICSLPFFPDMTADDVLKVVNAIKGILSNGRD
jgi:UDP-4-amino-4-deoxy-L-arabinose-oxoglutarate aminotransferase